MADAIDPRYSDDEAARIWRRAAELQAARRLPSPNEARGGAGADAAPGPDHLSTAEILAIGSEAGIDPEFVEQALAEAEFAPPAADGTASEFLTRRHVDAPPAVVQAVLREVAERAPFGLRLIDIRAVRGARVLVFDLAPDWGSPLNAGSLAAAPNLLALHAMLREGNGPETTELTLHGPPNPSLPRSVRRHDLAFGGAGAILGGLLGAGTATELALTGVALAGPAALGALALGIAGAGVMRAAQRWARRKDAASLEKLADETVGAIRIRRHAARLEPPTS